MTHDEKLAILTGWEERMTAIEEAYDTAARLLGMEPEAPLPDAIWRMVDHYTEIASDLLGDESHCLHWYWWGPQDDPEVRIRGKTYMVRDVESLLEVIEAYGEP